MKSYRVPPSGRIESIHYGGKRMNIAGGAPTVRRGDSLFVELLDEDCVRLVAKPASCSECLRPLVGRYYEIDSALVCGDCAGWWVRLTKASLQDVGTLL